MHISHLLSSTMRRRMGALPLSLGDRPKLAPVSPTNAPKDHGALAEEIPGLIRVYEDGHVERLPAILDVPCTWSPEPDVACSDVVVSHSTGVWARLYVPKPQPHGETAHKLPLLVYFHGGGFCVGSAAWRCYHEFLARLASRARCLVASVNYRLAPEHRLPAAYDDGLAAVRWVRQQQTLQAGQRGAPAGACPDDLGNSWRASCDFARVFLGGDSAGATIAYNVAAQAGGSLIRGVLLIQPFFGGEARTPSERNSPQSSRSALSLATSDCYWRMALPAGADRDHPWCNPAAAVAEAEGDQGRGRGLPAMLVCVSELDILKDRNMEFCKAMRRAGRDVETAMYAGVGHAFQVLHNYHMSHARTHEMLTHIKAFISSR